MSITRRLFLALWCAFIKIGAIELLYALNFSSFSYHRIMEPAWFSYVLAAATTATAFYLLTFLGSAVHKTGLRRPLFTVYALVVVASTLAIVILGGRNREPYDLATFLSLLGAEIAADYTLGYSL